MEEKIFLAEKFKEILRKRGLSLREFAHRSGISLSSLSAWVNGTRNPKVPNIYEMANALGCSMQDISLFGDGAIDWDEAIPAGDDDDDMVVRDPYSGTLINCPKKLPSYPKSHPKTTKPPSSKSNAELVSPSALTGRLVPVVGQAAAVQASGMVYAPLAECIMDYSEADKVYFRLAKPGDFVIRIQGESMMPWYPPGTLVLVRPNQRLKSGQRVVAITKEDEIMFKIFVDFEGRDYFYLMSINNSNGKDIKCMKDSSCPVREMWLVIESARDELALDRAMEEANIDHGWQARKKEIEGGAV